MVPHLVLLADSHGLEIRQIGHGFGVHGLGSTAHPMISNESPGQTWLILVYLGLAQLFWGAT